MARARRAVYPTSVTGQFDSAGHRVIRTDAVITAEFDHAHVLPSRIVDARAPLIKRARPYLVCQLQPGPSEKEGEYLRRYVQRIDTCLIECVQGLFTTDRPGLLFQHGKQID